MKFFRHSKKGQPPQTDARRGFFEEIQVEFLIHELKDPIAVIETGVRTLLEKREKYGPLSPRQERVLKRTLRNSNKARTMLNGLLEIGRSESGCFLCCPFQPVSATYAVLLETMDALDDEISEQFRAFRQEKQALEFLSRHGIFLDIAPRVLETEIIQDETKFRQILGNLIKNALHHRKQRVDIKFRCEDERLLVEIRDDGPGIDPAHHEMIFRRYTQVKQCALPPRNRHGLGLAGARILARCLGGDIELDSQKGQGATFRLILPQTLEGVD